MQLIRVGLLWTTTLFAAAAVAQPTAEELTATLRESLEGQFRDATGLGFTSFECDIEIADSPPQELTCQAVDEEGDQFFYRLVSQAGDQPVKVTTSQPVSQLNPAALEVLVAPCVEFLDAFGRSDWPTAHASLSPELQEVFALDQLRASLGPIREVLGEVNEVRPTLYSTPSAGVHLLEYDLASQGGDAVARFRLQFGEDEKSRILAFLVTARPGSALQATMLTDSGRQTLTPLLGQSVRAIDAPLSGLQLTGDAVEGTASLDDGSVVAIRVEQNDTAHDLDGSDYSFEVIDASWLIHRYLVSAGETLRSIDCPTPTTPDGGQLECAVTMSDGSQRSVTLSRRGGEHRLVQ